MLKDAADVMETAIRRTDHAGRLADDSFGAVLVGCKGLEGAAAFIGRYGQSLTRVTQERPAQLELSYAICSLGDAESPEAALARIEAEARSGAVRACRGGRVSPEAGTATPPPPKGVVPPSEPGGRSGFLSDVIVELGFATSDAVEEAVREARSGSTVAQVLVESGAISEEQLARATAERYGLAYIDLDSFEVDPQAAALIRPSAAKRYQAVPVGFVGGEPAGGDDRPGGLARRSTTSP